MEDSYKIYFPTLERIQNLNLNADFYDASVDSNNNRMHFHRESETYMPSGFENIQISEKMPRNLIETTDDANHEVI